MKRWRVYRKLAYCISLILLFTHCALAIDTMSNPEWYIDMGDSGYSDWMIECIFGR